MLIVSQSSAGSLRNAHPDLSAITIEVMMISAAMLHGKNNPTLARE